MENPLLGADAGAGSPTRHRYTSSSESDRLPLFTRRTDAITRGSLYEKAAALVDLVGDGVGLPEEILERSSFEKDAKLYFVYTRLDFVWSVAYFALIVLNFLERPLWCAKDSEWSCGDTEYYFLGLAILDRRRVSCL